MTSPSSLSESGHLSPATDAFLNPYCHASVVDTGLHSSRLRNLECSGNSNPRGRCVDNEEDRKNPSGCLGPMGGHRPEKTDRAGLEASSDGMGTGGRNSRGASANRRPLRAKGLTTDPTAGR